MLYDSFKLDDRSFTETSYGYLFPVTLAAEMVQGYGQGNAYKSAQALTGMVKEVHKSGRDIPITLEHPTVENDTWGTRATVGMIPSSTLFFDQTCNKVKGLGCIFKGNEWIKDLITTGQEHGVSIGFNSKDIAERGQFNNINYDFRQEDISLDHLAISLQTMPRCPNGVCGFFADSKKTDPEVTEEYVRIPVAEPSGGEIRTITMSPEKGIKGLIEIKNGASRVVTYLFEAAKWTMETAKNWIEEHKPHASNADALDKDSKQKMAEETKPPVETPKTDVSDCTKRIDSLIAEYEKKLVDAKAEAKTASDAEIAKIRDEFQKKFDTLIEARKPAEPPKEEAKVDAKPDVPAVGEKSVKPPAADAGDPIEERIELARAKRMNDNYMFKAKK